MRSGEELSDVSGVSPKSEAGQRVPESGVALRFPPQSKRTGRRGRCGGKAKFFFNGETQRTQRDAEVFVSLRSNPLLQAPGVRLRLVLAELGRGEARVPAFAALVCAGDHEAPAKPVQSAGEWCKTQDRSRHWTGRRPVVWLGLEWPDCGALRWTPEPAVGPGFRQWELRSDPTARLACHRKPSRPINPASVSAADAGSGTTSTTPLSGLKVAKIVFGLARSFQSPPE